jgi:flavin reductase (DIM6/NTAB) family NADH-FMN oxidoreductase RutF
MRKSVPLSRVYRLLEPGPVVMVTSERNGEANAMTMSWHTMIDFEPPLVGCIISDRNYSFEIIRETKECVINIPTVELLPQIVGVGNTSGRNVDKFRKFHLTKEAGSQVSAPMIRECYASLECKVIDMQLAAKYDLFILQVLKAWIRPTKKRARMVHHAGKGVFVVDGKVIRMLSKKK